MVQLTIDYWRVESADVAESLDAVLGQAVGWSQDDPRRNLTHLGRVVRLRRIERAGDSSRGEFTSIGVNEGGFRADVRGAWDPIPFKEEEGLGRAAAFIYSPQNRVLALERKRTVASSSVVSRFFSQLEHDLADIDLLPIPTRDARERFARLIRVSSVEVAVAGGTGSIPDEVDAGALALVRLQERLGVPVLRMKLTVGHEWRTKSLLMNPVQSLVRSLQREEAGELKKLVVTGNTPDHDRDIIDLTTERIKDVVDLEPDEGREVSYSLRVRTIAAYLSERRPDLRLE